MSLDTKTFADAPYESEQILYRAVSKPAVFSLLIGLLAAFGAFIPILLAVAPAGILLGLWALRAIRRYPDELSGKIPAFAGVLLCSIAFVGGVGWHTYVYLTEVPDGYLRISFANLQPVPERPELPVSPESLELDGKRVFIKGYLYPDGRQANIQHFILVPDLGTCCFGGQPKLTDMIEVRLQDPHRLRYSMRKRKLGGVLKVDTQLKPISGLQGVYYQLDADYVR